MEESPEKRQKREPPIIPKPFSSDIWKLIFCALSSLWDLKDCMRVCKYFNILITSIIRDFREFLMPDVQMPMLRTDSQVLMYNMLPFANRWHMATSIVADFNYIKTMRYKFDSCNQDERGGIIVQWAHRELHKFHRRWHDLIAEGCTGISRCVFCPVSFRGGCLTAILCDTTRFIRLICSLCTQFTPDPKHWNITLIPNEEEFHISLIRVVVDFLLEALGSPDTVYIRVDEKETNRHHLLEHFRSIAGSKHLYNLMFNKPGLDIDDKFVSDVKRMKAILDYRRQPVTKPTGDDINPP